MASNTAIRDYCIVLRHVSLPELYLANPSEANALNCFRRKLFSSDRLTIQLLLTAAIRLCQVLFNLYKQPTCPNFASVIK